MSKSTTQSEFIPPKKFKLAMISKIELKNGTQTQIITFFNNNEINLENLNIGLNTGLKRSPNVKKYQNIIINNQMKEIISFNEQINTI